MDSHVEGLARGTRTLDAHPAINQNRRSGLEHITYGIAMGPITTAIGALVSERLVGITRIAVWSTVTTILAIGAVVLAEPSLNILSRFLRVARGR